MVTFACHVCQTELSVADHLAGEYVRCPVCRTAVKAPTGAPAVAELENPPAAIGEPLADVPSTGDELSLAAEPSTPPLPPVPPQQPFARYLPPPGPGRRFGFPCCYCSSHLEATTDQSGNEGTCPTCGSSIIVPILGNNGQLIDPLTRQVIKPDPHPVHAYAAAGERAPQIIKDPSGNRVIRCPRCAATSVISANVCSKCGVPFTIEGSENIGRNASGNGLASASLILGILSMPMFFLFVPAILAIILGVMAMVRSSRGAGGGGLAIAGIATGIVGLVIGISAVA